MSIQYEKIKVGDRLVCNVLSNYGVIPVEHIVTKNRFFGYVRSKTRH